MDRGLGASFVGKCFRTHNHKHAHGTVRCTPWAEDKRLKPQCLRVNKQGVSVRCFLFREK